MLPRDDQYGSLLDSVLHIVYAAAQHLIANHPTTDIA